jgi:hypothetical protein
MRLKLPLKFLSAVCDISDCSGRLWVACGGTAHWGSFAERAAPASIHQRVGVI